MRVGGAPSASLQVKRLDSGSSTTSSPPARRVAHPPRLAAEGEDERAVAARLQVDAAIAVDEHEGQDDGQRPRRGHELTARRTGAGRRRQDRPQAVERASTSGRSSGHGIEEKPLEVVAEEGTASGSAR
jgi:hypothetical protein